MIIKNGLIYDGKGGKPFRADLRITGEKISEIGENLSQSGADEVVINARDRAVTPGFIDIHRHCDNKPFLDMSFGDPMLAQGITTTVVGNCGISPTPCNPDPCMAQEAYDFDEPVLGPPIRNIKTYHEYINSLEDMDLPLNMAAMIGTGNVKIAVKGFADTPFSEQEMEKAREYIDAALEEGAPGISVGIMYLPECYNTTDDYVRMFRDVSKYDGIVTAHIRGEGDSMVRSVEEMIDIGKRAGCRVEISHFKSCGMKNWHKEIYRAIDAINEARAQGQWIGCDLYPYDGGSTALTTMLPPAFVAGDMASALKKLGTKEGVDQFRKMASVEYDDWDNFCITLGWDRILISGVVKEHNRKFLGYNVKEAAEKFGFPDDYALAAYLMNDENGRTAIINLSMCQDDIDEIVRLPYSCFISDSIYAQTSTPHPRMYGAFPKVIREYVNERHLLTLEEAVKKMTWLPADRMRLNGKGKIETGCDADINIFDPDKLKDRATYENPTLLSEGMDYCIVNGNVAYQNGKKSDRNFGRAVKVRR